MPQIASPHLKNWERDLVTLVNFLIYVLNYVWQSWVEIKPSTAYFDHVTMRLKRCRTELPVQCCVNVSSISEFT